MMGGKDFNELLKPEKESTAKETLCIFITAGLITLLPILLLFGLLFMIIKEAVKEKRRPVFYLSYFRCPKCKEMLFEEKIDFWSFYDWPPTIFRICFNEECKLYGKTFLFGYDLPKETDPIEYKVENIEIIDNNIIIA